MAAIPTILAGDTSAAITIALAEGFDYSDAALHVRYKGVEKVFTGLVGGSSLALQFTADETAGFRLGAAQVGMWLVYPGGAVRTIPTDNVRIKVTDSASEVYNATITLSPGAELPADATEGDSLGELKAKFNQLKAAIGAACLLAALALPAATARLNDLPGTNYVVTAETDPHAAGIVSGIVTKAYVEGLGITSGEGGIAEETDPTVPAWAKQPNKPAYTAEEVGAPGYEKEYFDEGKKVEIADSTGYSRVEVHSGYQAYPPKITLMSDFGTGLIIDAEEYQEYGVETFNERVKRITSDLTNGIPEAIASQQLQAANISNTVNAWQTYWDGDDVRVTITNYYGSADDPHLYIEQKMPADDDHDAPWFKVVWDEMTRLTSIIARVAAIETELPNKADRAWGYYDSATGNYSPDGLLQISHERIQIADGLAYTKQIATGCEVWVLTATEPTTITGVNSNGFFRITDGDGTPLLEIVKGDKRTVGATAAGITVSASEVTIPYNVVSDDHPEVVYCTDLVTANWQPATVTWGGQSGAWVAHVARPSGDSAFFKATYETGGETYIKHNVPCGLDRAYIGGRAYDITVDANGFLKVVQ